MVDGGFEDLLAGLERGEGLDAAAASAAASLAESAPGVSMYLFSYCSCVSMDSSRPIELTAVVYYILLLQYEIEAAGRKIPACE